MAKQTVIKDDELYFVEKFCCTGRVDKVLTKLKAEDEKIKENRHIEPMLVGLVYQDIIKEEGWKIAKRMSHNEKAFSFMKFEDLCKFKIREVYKALLASETPVDKSLDKVS